MAASYAADVTDEFVVPTALTGRGVRDGDAVVFFNFRPDRAREITRALVDPAFAGFERGACPQVSFVCLTEYDPEIPAPVAYPKEFPADVLADVLADLARTHQVIVVTHLAQVAVRGQAHYVVRKAAGDEGAMPETDLRQLPESERPAEIARMLSGDATETSLAHAREMLARAAG